MAGLIDLLTGMFGNEQKPLAVLPNPEIPNSALMPPDWVSNYKSRARSFPVPEQSAQSAQIGSDVLPPMNEQAQVRQIDNSIAGQQNQNAFGEQAQVRNVDNQLAALLQSSEGQQKVVQEYGKAKSEGFMGSIRDFLSDPETMARLAIGFNTMRLTPDQGLAAVMADRLKSIREQKISQAQSNKTIDYLLANKVISADDAASLRGNPELAKAVLSGFMARERKEGFTPVSGAELNKRIPGANFDPKAMYSLGESGKISEIGSMKTTIQVDASQKGVSKEFEEAAKYNTERFGKFVDAGDASSALRPEIQTLSILSQTAPSGPLTGRLATAFPGFSTAGDAFNAIISRIAPKMRVVGSGSSSDRDVAMLVESLGSLKNAPGANALIYQAFKDKIAIDEQRAEIANAALTKEISYDEATRQIRELNKRTIMSPELRAMVEASQGRGKGTSGMNMDAVGAPADVFNKMTNDEIAKYSRMTPEQKRRADQEIRNR